MKYILRFFELGEECCCVQFESDYPPLVPRKHEIVNFDDNDYLPYEVVNVEYSYPDPVSNDNFVLIDVTTEEVCE